jgi:hypothetical protein
MTFEEELVLLVIEKLLLGTVIGLVAYFAARALEHFRTRLSVIAETDKLRIAKIAELWEAFGEAELDLTVALEVRRRIVTEERDRLDRDAKMDLFAKRQLPAPAVERIQNEVVPLLQSGLDRVRKLPALVERKRVWAGKTLQEKHLTHMQRLVDFGAILSTTLLSGDVVEDLDRVKPALMLNFSRLDVPALVREL